MHKERLKPVQAIGYQIGESEGTAFLIPSSNGETALLVVPEEVEVGVLFAGEWVKLPSRMDGVYRIKPGEFSIIDLNTGEEVTIKFEENLNCLEKTA